MDKRFKKLLLAALIGFVAGIFWLVAIRFVTYQDNRVHYHANLALYVNGQKDPFDSFTFYEEVQSCGSDEVNNPRTRVHLHDNVPHVAHVHDAASTWEQLFANLGYTLGNDVIKTDDGVFVDGAEGNELKFVLNGQEVDAVANVTIRSEDVLLVNYGNDSAEILQDRYEGIVQDAADYNKRDDPSACKGNKPLTFWDRIRTAVGISN